MQKGWSNFLNLSIFICWHFSVKNFPLLTFCQNGLIDFLLIELRSCTVIYFFLKFPYCPILGQREPLQTDSFFSNNMFPSFLENVLIFCSKQTLEDLLLPCPRPRISHGWQEIFEHTGKNWGISSNENCPKGSKWGLNEWTYKHFCGFLKFPNWSSRTSITL